MTARAGGATTDAAGEGALPRSGFVLLGLLSFFWGINWPMMKWAVTEIRPWTFRAFCILVGVAAFAASANLHRFAK